MLVTLLVIVALGALTVIEASRGTPRAQAAFAPSLDPGTPLSGRAPAFTLTDQFGKHVSLTAFHGKVVLLAFNDAECTTICPLTTSVMTNAQRMLGASSSTVQLLGVDANPKATSIEAVRSYSELHGMTHRWDFTTGRLSQLKRVWRAYHVAVAIESGQVDHTPALFLIDTRGRLVRLYLTQMSYASITQQAQVVAHEISRLLPEHPRVHSQLSYAAVPSITPTEHVSVPRSGEGTLELGPGKPRLLLFFATWDEQVTDLTRQLTTLSGYANTAAAEHLPQLVAVDEATVEPSPSALPRMLAQLRSPLSYPVVIDRSGRLADGYEVQDEPWLVLVSAKGAPLWYQDVSTQGWPSQRELIRQLRAALSHAASTGQSATRAELSGSPPPLAALHAQAAKLIGSEPGLVARIHALRGFPIVLNVWASWCAPCRAEFGLLASASARYGREVAFLGADVNDSSGDARAFLSRHHVSYPSYTGSIDQMNAVLPQGLTGTPTTIFLNAAGRIVHVHPGQYEAQGSLDSDIGTYALQG